MPFTAARFEDFAPPKIAGNDVPAIGDEESLICLLDVPSRCTTARG